MKTIGAWIVQGSRHIITFSHIIEKYVQEHYDLEKIGQTVAVIGNLPSYQFSYGGKKFAFLKTYAGAPASDYITIKNADVVATFMKENEILFVKGKTWTTDSFYRETSHFKIALSLADYVS